MHPESCSENPVGIGFLKYTYAWYIDNDHKGIFWPGFLWLSSEILGPNEHGRE
jgi:hypothetical protein